jgi:S1-C subfamily serine protease
LVVEAGVPTVEAEAASEPRIEVVPTIQDGDTVALSGGVSGFGESFLGVPYQTNNLVTAYQQVLTSPGGAQVISPDAFLAVGAQTSQLGLRVTDGETQGVLVQSVVQDGLAAEAGILAGDLITSFAGTPVLGVRQLTRMLEETPEGRTVPLTVLREGETRSIEVTLERRAPVTVLGDVLTGYRDARATSLNAAGFRLLAPGTIRLGLRIESMTPELREFFGAPEDQGVLVSSVVADSPAAEAGMRVGDVIVSVDGNDVSSPAELTWSAKLEDPTVVLDVIRERRSQEVQVTLDLPARSLRIAP